MYGNGARRRWALGSTASTRTGLPSRRAARADASSAPSTSTPFFTEPSAAKCDDTATSRPSTLRSTALTFGSTARCMVMPWWSTDTKARRSISRCTIMWSAGLCTRPADRSGRTVFHRAGDTWNPTRKSRARRARAASTSFSSITPRFSIASRMASAVMALKRALLTGTRGARNSTSRWAIISPSRSASVAITSSSAPARRRRSSSTTAAPFSVTR